MQPLEPTDSDYTKLFQLTPILECLTPMARESLKVIILTRQKAELEARLAALTNAHAQSPTRDD